MKDFDEIYFEIQRRKWKIDISKLKDGIYEGNIDAPKDITEFKGFKEELGIEINNVIGYLSFEDCKNLTNVGVLPDIVGRLDFTGCFKLTRVDKFPKVTIRERYYIC